MTDEKQINNTKNQRRDNYCIRIQNALNYKGNCDHEDLPSILVAFEKEIKNELLPENAVVLTKEEYKMVLETQKHLEKKYSDMRDELNLCKNENEIIKQNYIQLKQDNDQARKETAREILKKGNEYLMQSTDKACAFACFLGIMEHDYGVEVEECI